LVSPSAAATSSPFVRSAQAVRDSGLESVAELDEELKMRRGLHPNSRRNLRPWKPGDVPNPEGKNSAHPFTSRYKRMSEAPAPAELIAKVNKEFKTPILPPGSSWAALTTARLYLQIVIKGDVNALKEIVDRVEGKAPNRLDLMTDMHQEITFKVVEEEPIFPRNRTAEILFSHCKKLVEVADDPEVMEAAAALALILRKKGNVKFKPQTA
jgi:hypothetical protein